MAKKNDNLMELKERYGNIELYWNKHTQMFHVVEHYKHPFAKLHGQYKTYKDAFKKVKEVRQ